MPGTLVQEHYAFSQISASAAVKSGPGLLGGVFVSSVTGSPTVTIYDNTAASGTKIADAFVPTAAKAYPFPSRFSTGLYVAISGTCSLTVFYD
jgi:hypothetical protein